MHLRLTELCYRFISDQMYCCFLSNFVLITVAQVGPAYQKVSHLSTTQTHTQVNSGYHKHIFLSKEQLCARERPSSVLTQAKDTYYITGTHHYERNQHSLSRGSDLRPPLPYRQYWSGHYIPSRPGCTDLNSVAATKLSHS